MTEEAVSSNTVWKATREPHSRRIFKQRKSDKLAYKIKIREGNENEQFSYSNSLHDALSGKEGDEFWKCWKAKFESNNTCVSNFLESGAKHFYVTCFHMNWMLQSMKEHVRLKQFFERLLTISDKYCDLHPFVAFWVPVKR